MSLTRPQDRTQFAKSRFALGRGGSEGLYPGRYSTERATKPQGKTALARRVAALLACGFVARRVTERCGYALVPVRKHLPPRHKPKSPATNCILSYGLVSMGISAATPLHTRLQLCQISLPNAREHANHPEAHWARFGTSLAAWPW